METCFLFLSLMNLFLWLDFYHFPGFFDSVVQIELICHALVNWLPASLLLILSFLRLSGPFLCYQKFSSVDFPTSSSTMILHLFSLFSNWKLVWTEVKRTHIFGVNWLTLWLPWSDVYHDGALLSCLYKNLEHFNFRNQTFSHSIRKRTIELLEVWRRFWGEKSKRIEECPGYFLTKSYEWRYFSWCFVWSRHVISLYFDGWLLFNYERLRFSKMFSRLSRDRITDISSTLCVHSQMYLLNFNYKFFFWCKFHYRHWLNSFMGPASEWRFFFSKIFEMLAGWPCMSGQKKWKCYIWGSVSQVDIITCFKFAEFNFLQPSLLFSHEFVLLIILSPNYISRYFQISFLVCTVAWEGFWRFHLKTLRRGWDEERSWIR